MHKFPKDFYGSLLKTCIVGYIRPEQSFDSLGNVMLKALVDSM